MLVFIKVIRMYIVFCFRAIRTAYHDQAYDKKYNINTLTFPVLTINHAENPSKYNDGTVCDSTAYSTLSRILSSVKVSENDVFVDLGCGLGRAVCCIAGKRLKKVIGIEIVKKYAERAGNNYANHVPQLATPAEIIVGDVAVFKEQEGTIYFIYNPFGYRTIKAVIENIRESLEANQRTIRIIYYCCLHEGYFNDAPWLEPDPEFTGVENVRAWRNRPCQEYAGKTSIIDSQAMSR